MKPTLNLKKAEKDLNKLFKTKSLVFQVQVVDNQLQCLSSFSIKHYDDDVFARFEFNTNATADFCFTFDHLQINEQTLRMVNELNEKNLFFRAYVETEKKYLRLHYSIFDLPQDKVADTTAIILSYLSDKSLIPLLGPICVLTEGDNN